MAEDREELLGVYYASWVSFGQFLHCTCLIKTRKNGFHLSQEKNEQAHPYMCP